MPREHVTPGTRLSDGITIKEYFERLFMENQRALDKAERMMNQRLEGMNEFRETLKDQASKFITRDELKTILEPMCADIKALRKLADIAEGKASQTALFYTAIISIVGLILGLTNTFVK